MRERVRKPMAAAGLLCAVAAFFFAPRAGAAGPESAASMYSTGGIVAIDLTLPPSSLEVLKTEPKSDEYVEGTFSAASTDGTPSGISEFTAPQKVEVRLKGGEGSFREIGEKAAFKLKFPKTGLFLGLRRMTLNNMVQDPSMLHEALAYELFRALGVPASRTGYAFLRINGEPYGVYLNIETLDEFSLPRWFGSTRHLYEADVPGTDLGPASASKFEVDVGEEGDVSDLEALIDAANDTEGDWSEAMASVADLDEMARMWAVERYIGHWDGYAGTAGAPSRPNNYYLHSLDSGVFQMVPWGTDQTWDFPVGFDWPAGGLLFNRCLADTSCWDVYEGALGEVAAIVPGLALDAKAICTAELLAPWQALEGPERREYDAAQILDGVEDVRDFVALRPAELAEWLGADAPAAPAREDSCSADEVSPAEQPETPPTTPEQSDSVVPERLGFGVLSVRAGRGSAPRSRLRLPGPGVLTLRGTTTAAGERPRSVCFRRLEVERAGARVVRCPLLVSARERLRSGALEVRLSIRFRSADGVAQQVTRRITIPAL